MCRVLVVPDGPKIARGIFLTLVVPLGTLWVVVKAYPSVELEERLDAYCARTGASRSAAVSLALEAFLRHDGGPHGTWGVALGEGVRGVVGPVAHGGIQDQFPASAGEESRAVVGSAPSPSVSRAGRTSTCEHRIPATAFCKVCDS